MREHHINFELPRNIERYLAALSKLYAQDGKPQLQEIIVNTQTRVIEAWSADNWNGGTYGHALYLTIPEAIFLNAVKYKDVLQNQIKTDLNNIQNIQNEFIEKVFLDIGAAEDSEWRKASGLLVTRDRIVPPDATERIWGNGFRIFLSHKSEVKKEVAKLKAELTLFGISCFVAHMDIHPTKSWQDEIEYALGSMDAFVALITPNFHDSDWTDQEVGFAFARGIPMIAVRLGKDPYGFIGKFQALSSTWAGAAKDIAKLLIKKDRMFSVYVQALRKCTTWEDGNILATVLPNVERLTKHQIDELIAAYNETPKLHGSFGFNGLKPSYGEGIIFHLNRVGNRQFTMSKTGLIELISH